MGMFLLLCVCVCVCVCVQNSVLYKKRFILTKRLAAAPRGMFLLLFLCEKFRFLEEAFHF